MHSSSRVLDRLRQREADNVVAELRDEELEFHKN